ncbi:hypothetical protein J5A71_08960 [Prevotella melaninogenica]|uniref:hypothetical protein n=1 Tax=Prevotella melaninogenica TaxID=28132 RepID=UPI001BA6DE35|nr:hypothetical protein [Prevotella melaninogenica]QUB57399.1 hypothetical protein J5A72_08270 [Prevotella melaninogenica]QUB59787.1 hypothetical protein J5A71_08960 [Prevotella melaninogenica]
MEKLKRAYVQPACGFIYTEIETLMTQTSGSAGTIGHGSQAGDAKQAPAWIEEEEEDEDKAPWLTTNRTSLYD